MGVRILNDRDQDLACLFCSTSDVAFGPVFYDGEHGDAEDRAEAFLRWIQTTETWSNYEPVGRLSLRRDVRIISERGLLAAYSDWLAQEADQVKREHEAEMAE
jgi:hypothetical protein